MAGRQTALSTSLGRRKKRKIDGDGEIHLESNFDQLPCCEIPNDTKSALDHILSLFPREKFLLKLPSIALRHQLYSILTDKTKVDRELNSLRDKGEIQLIKLDSGNEQYAIVKMSDYVEHVASCAKLRAFTSNPIIDEFFQRGLPKIKDVIVERETLTEFQFSDDLITYLINLGVLNTRDVHSWWISIPGNSLFMKSLLAGRKAILSMISKRKYKEMFEKECESKDLKRHSKLGMKYHLYDLVGCSMIVKIPSSSGILLRAADDKKSGKKKR